jgi:hypothetical protein
MADQEKYACLCCGFKTLDEPSPGTFDICPVCFWEDDYVQSENPNCTGGANRVSLTQARKNFAKFGVSELKFRENVRKPAHREVFEKQSRIS